MGWNTYIADKGPITTDDVSNEIIKALGEAADAFFNKFKRKRGNQTNFIKKELAILGYNSGFCVYTCLSYSKAHDPIKKLENDDDTGKYIELIRSALEQNKAKDGFGNHLFRNTEWLYDIHWYRDKPNSHYMPERVFLVAECELGKRRSKDPNMEDRYSGVKYDFQKLLVSNAKLRLMIFQISCEDIIYEPPEELDKYFEEAIDAYDDLEDGSKFLFACYNNDARKLLYCEKQKKKS
jgi:hypothetical protein